MDAATADKGAGLDAWVNWPSQMAALYWSGWWQAGEQVLTAWLDLQSAWVRQQEAWMATALAGADDQWTRLWRDAVTHDLQEQRQR